VSRPVERVQTGVRVERRILGVLKAVADLQGVTLGDLIEGLALHAFEGKPPFGAATLERIRALRTAFDLDLTARDSHLLRERGRRGDARPVGPSRRRSP
jgi:hypothetical protein